MKIIWSLISVGFISAPALAQQAVNCPDKVERRGSIQLQQTPSGDNNGCFISVHNFKADDLLYRDYLLSSDGNLMVFNSFGNGPENEFTGAREFYMFPRPNKTMTYNWNDDARRLEVVDVTGGTVYFDYEDAQISGMTKAAVKVAPDVVPANNGGVEISKFQGLILDAGFTKGHAPTGVAAATSVFTDQSGQTCKVKNGDVFKYTSEGDVNFKYSDKGLMAFLKTKCPKLKLPAAN